jgi:class 3 adenylate cyclase/YHS domain-containing protein
MGDELTLEELSKWTDVPVGDLRQWRSLGLIGAGDEERFRPEDVERARLVQMFLRHGISLESIARTAVESGVLDRYAELLTAGASGRRYSLVEAAELLDLDPELLRRIASLTGLSTQRDTLDELDIEVFQQFKAAKQAGFPEEALIQAVKVYADAMSRVGEMEARLFHFYILDRLRAQGLSGPDLVAASNAAADRATAVIEPVILYWHRRGFERALREDAVLRIAEEAGLREKGEVPGQLERAVVFVDLSSFTPLAEAMGDDKAAEVLERFSALVREAAGRRDGRVVKQIGDAFMLVFPDARSAVACALEIEAGTAAEPQFPASRSGVHWGPVLYREGDYVGANVNIAARVAAEAQRHQTLVTATARREAAALPDVEFVRLDKRRLRGLTDELELFEARPGGGERAEKVVDPVCGMELRPQEVAARLSVKGKDLAFCSDDCLRRFVVSPESYSS